MRHCPNTDCTDFGGPGNEYSELATTCPTCGTALVDGSEPGRHAPRIRLGYVDEISPEQTERPLCPACARPLKSGEATCEQCSETALSEELQDLESGPELDLSLGARLKRYSFFSAIGILLALALLAEAQCRAA